MNLQFDKHGLITPKEIIELSLTDFEQIFVKERKEKAHRQTIFDEYLRHNEKIQLEIGAILFQFINGSFTTLKAKPNDIDVVSFIYYRIFRKKEEEIIHYMNYYRGVEKIDRFISMHSYPGHPLFMRAQFDLDYWEDLFTLTKPNKAGKQFKKGLIKINFYD